MAPRRTSSSSSSNPGTTTNVTTSLINDVHNLLNLSSNNIIGSGDSIDQHHHNNNIHSIQQHQNYHHHNNNHQQQQFDSTQQQQQQQQLTMNLVVDTHFTQCCLPSGECFKTNCVDFGLINLDDLTECIRVICNNENCTTGQYMHQECFEQWEQGVLSYLKSIGRARSWSDRQRQQNLWTKKGYDLVFKACGCKCGRGHLKKDLDWSPPSPTQSALTTSSSSSIFGNRLDDESAKKKKKRNRQNQKPILIMNGNNGGSNGNNVIGNGNGNSQLSNNNNSSANIGNGNNHESYHHHQQHQQQQQQSPNSSSTHHQQQQQQIGNGVILMEGNNNNNNNINGGLLNNSNSMMATIELRTRTGSLSSSNGSSSPPASAGSSEHSVSPVHSGGNGNISGISNGNGIGDTIGALKKAKTKVEVYSERVRTTSGCNGIFSRRLDFSTFNMLPRTRLNSYQIKMEDEGNHGNDETRLFILSSLAQHQKSRVSCILCEEAMLVFDRYPLVDGTFFLSPKQHAKGCIEVKYDGQNQFLTAVCMGCLEGVSPDRIIRCRFCAKKWDGSSLVLGTMYAYDIFAAMPCCTERLKCNNCFKLLLYPHQRLNFFSDYSHIVSCVHCATQDTHFVKPLAYCYTKQPLQAFQQWP